VSILAKLGIHGAFGVVLLTLGLILALAPWWPGKDLGIFKIPTFGESNRRSLKWGGPLSLVLAIALHVPFLDDAGSANRDGPAVLQSPAPVTPSVPTPAGRGAPSSPQPPTPPTGSTSTQPAAPVTVKIVSNVGSRAPWFDPAVSTLPADRAAEGLHRIQGTVIVRPLSAGGPSEEYLLEWWWLTPDGNEVYLTGWQDDDDNSTFSQSKQEQTYWAKSKTLWSDKLGRYEFRVYRRSGRGELQSVGTASVSVDC